MGEGPIEVRGEILHIPLTRGKVAIADASDLHRLEGISWCAMPTKKGRSFIATGWLHAPVNAQVRMSRWILGVTDSAVLVDHINGDTLDNRRSNLREATAAENSRNRAPKSDGPGYKGICRQQNRRWRACIFADGVWRNIGAFATREEAAVAYDVVAMQLHGEFAWLNHKHFPNLLPLLDKRLKETAA